MSQPCDQERLERYVAGERSPEEGHAIVAHADGCAACRKELLQLQRDRERFVARAHAETAPPQALWEAIEAQLAPAPPISLPPQRPSRAPVWAGGLVAVAATLLLGVRFLGGPAAVGPPPASPVTAHVAADRASPGAALPPITVPGARRLNERHEPTTFSVGAGARLRVEVIDSDVRIKVGRADAIVIAPELDDEEIDPRWLVLVAQQPDGVVLRVWCDGGSCRDSSHATFEIDAPADTSVEVHAISGDLSIDRLSGALDVTSVSGDVTIVGGRELKVESTSGDVHIEKSASGQQRVRTVSGDVYRGGSCAKGCALALDSVSGDVKLALEAPSSFALRYQSVSGDVERGDRVKAGEPVEEHAFTLDTGTREGSIRVKTVSGDLSFDDELSAAP